MASSETVDLDGLGIELETIPLVNEEFLDILALISLELDHLPHLSVVDNGSIAGYFEDRGLVSGRGLERSAGAIVFGVGITYRTSS